MSWRTLVIANRCKLDLSLNYMEIRGEETKKVHLSEIHTVIIDSTVVSLTSALLCELMHRKIKVIFCDERRNPQSELIPYYGTTDTSARIRQQICWDDATKGIVWAEIIAEKIRQQQSVLRRHGEEQRAMLLGHYIDDIEEADSTNREGHAAKVYFGGLFGADFSRAQDCTINAALNYGYSVLLSAFNKEIAAAGYMTQLGIFHDNMFNPFNLASDMMEPFRPLVDEIVCSMKPSEFNRDVKASVINVLNQQVEIDGQVQYVSNAIRIYSRSVIDAMNEKRVNELRFYKPYVQKQTKKAEPAPEKASLLETASALMQKLETLHLSERKSEEEV